MSNTLFTVRGKERVNESLKGDLIRHRWHQKRVPIAANIAVVFEEKNSSNLVEKKKIRRFLAVYCP